MVFFIFIIKFFRRKNIKYWKVEKVNKSNDGESVELRDNTGDEIEVSFKWDGCIDLRKYYNGYAPEDKWSKEVEENTDYVHICNITEVIERLQELKEIMEKYGAEI